MKSGLTSQFKSHMVSEQRPRGHQTTSPWRAGALHVAATGGFLADARSHSRGKARVFLEQHLSGTIGAHSRVGLALAAASRLVASSMAAVSVFSSAGSDCAAAVFFSAFFATAFAAVTAAFSVLARCTAACCDAFFAASTAALLTAGFGVGARLVATVAAYLLPQS